MCGKFARGLGEAGDGCGDCWHLHGKNNCVMMVYDVAGSVASLPVATMVVRHESCLTDVFHNNLNLKYVLMVWYLRFIAHSLRLCASDVHIFNCQCNVVESRPLSKVVRLID